MLARRVGLLLALGTRLLLLASIAWVAGLDGADLDHRLVRPRTCLSTCPGATSSCWAAACSCSPRRRPRSITISKAAKAGAKTGKYVSFGAAIVQIAILDIVFSLDSVITAVGMADHLSVMVAAVIAAMIVVIAAAGPVGNFVDKHPTVKMLALSFLLLIGMALLGEGLHFHIPKAYLYFAIAFSVLVEFLNLWARKKKAKA